MITSHPFGNLPDGRAVTCYRLAGGADSFVEVLDYGATIRAIVVPDRAGNPTDVVLGFDTPGEYQASDTYFGAIVGRHANRIGGGTFTLNGETYALAINNGPNHLHGGLDGFDNRFFSVEILGDTLKMHLVSPHGDQGYPGTLTLTVSVTFSEENALTIRYEAVTDRDTVVNLTNHSYFDLSGGKDSLGQLLTIDADHYTENDENTLPTGAVLSVADTPFDFRTEKTVGRDNQADHPQIARCNGYDHNFVLKNGGALREFALLRSSVTGITMTAATDLPGVQLYGANFVDVTGKNGTHYGPYSGCCLETQFFPNAMAVEHFQKPILRAGETFDHTTVYRFSL